MSSMSNNTGRSPEELGEELVNLAKYVETGAFPRPPRIEPRELAALVAELSEAAVARLTLARDRPVKPKQLAALARVPTERFRHLTRTGEGYIAPGPAREWLANSGVPGVDAQRFDLTPSWWKQTLPGDRRRRAAETLLGRELPDGIFVDSGLTALSLVLPGGSPLGDEALGREGARLQPMIEALR